MAWKESHVDVRGSAHVGGITGSKIEIFWGIFGPYLEEISKKVWVLGLATSVMAEQFVAGDLFRVPNTCITDQ